MLRILYLLILLVCIKLSFCYNYIEETTEHNINNLRRNVRKHKVRRARRPHVRKSPISQEDDYDRSPVEFDVASFVQPDKDNAEVDEMSMRHRNDGRWTSKPFYLGPMLNNDEKNNKMDKTSDFMSMVGSLPDLNMGPPLSKDLLNTKHFGYDPLDELNAGKYGHEKLRNIYKDELLLNPNGFHSHEKKCSIKAIKFPFFSHNKSQPLKPKKSKKRKLFFFNNCKKETAEIPDISKMNDETMIPYKIKRSYEQRLCPACKKIFVASMQHDRPRKNSNKFIHNSRQFYQNALNDATLKDEIKNYRTIKKISNSDDKYRSKRENDRDRQLKELTEVQKKIDAVEIRLPQFGRPAENKVVYN